jgi:hypothetical protein
MYVMLIFTLRVLCYITCKNGAVAADAAAAAIAAALTIGLSVLVKSAFELGTLVSFIGRIVGCTMRFTGPLFLSFLFDIKKSFKTVLLQQIQEVKYFNVMVKFSNLLINSSFKSLSRSLKENDLALVESGK